jgi:hypothetical protein
MRRMLTREDGQIVVIFALMAVVLLMMIGLAVDAGLLFVAHRSAQEAADAGAYGGALVLYQEGAASDARVAARADVARNGYVDGGLTFVTVNIPPASGPHNGDSRFVEVIIETQVGTFILPQPGSLNRVVVRGVAGAAPVNLNHAIMALNQNVNDAFLLGNGDVNVTGGGIHINSNACGPALKLASDGDLNAPYTRVRGCVDDSGPGEITPAPLTGVPFESDPFAGLAGPSTVGMTNWGELNISSCGTFTLLPGIYEGMNLSSGSCTTVNLTPGIYVVRKKGINLSGDMTVQVDPLALPSQGVMIYNTIEGYPSSSPTTCDKINFSGNGVLSIRASRTGPYAGMLIFQDRRCTAEMYVSGNGQFHAITGSIYLPQAPFHISGNGTFATWNTRLLAMTFKNSGDATFTLHYDSNLNAQPVLPALWE